MIQMAPAYATVGILSLFGFVVTFFWMYIAWRAMRAHEELARATTSLAQAATQQATLARFQAEGRAND